MMAQAPDELTAFCHAEFARLTGILGLYLGDRAVAEELAQETLVRVARHWKRVSRLQSPTGWSYRVAINLATSHLRRRQAARRARTRLGHDREVEHHDADVADRLAVREAVLALPERQRAALILRWYADLSVADAAAAMGVSADAVRSLTKRALAALRDELREPLPEEADADV